MESLPDSALTIDERWLTENFNGLLMGISGVIARDWLTENFNGLLMVLNGVPCPTMINDWLAVINGEL